MAQGVNTGERDQPTGNKGVRYTLEQYRDDRVGANIRRQTMERNSAVAEYAAPDSSPSAESLRRRAVLRETSLQSAFEYVNYNMPETVPQEVVARRQIAKDLTAPGILSDGHNVADIVHQPPRHATLSPPAARSRSSRDALRSRDLAMAHDENVAPLPRPYVPRGVIDSYGEPYQYNRRQDGGPALTRQLRGQASAHPQASRNLQVGLWTANGNSNPDRMGLVEVEEIVRFFEDSETHLNIGRNEILSALRSLQQNWYPEVAVIRDTGIADWVLQFRDYPNPEVAQLATDILKGWRREIRMIEGRKLATNSPTQDPFVDEGADSYGETLPSDRWDGVIHDRQLAAHDYNAAASAEIHAAWQRCQREEQQQRDAQNRENQRLHIEAQAAAGAAVSPITEPGTASDSNVIVADPEVIAHHHRNHHGGEGEHQRDPNPTIIDLDEDLMPTGDQDFEIHEADPSPERLPRVQEINVLRERPRDVPLQSIEVEGPVGPCHECPDFPGTYHHVCAPDNPQCVNLPAMPPRAVTSSSSRPSQTPRSPRQRSPEGQNELVDLLERAARADAPDVQPACNILLNFPADNTSLGRTGLASTRKAGIPQVRHSANVPEDMADLYISTQAPKGFAIKKRSDGQDLMGPFSLLSPTVGLKSRVRPAMSPTVLDGSVASTSYSVRDARARGPRPRRADYAASTPAELYEELVNLCNKPASQELANKEDMERLLMTLDTSGSRGNGAPSGLNTGTKRSGNSGRSNGNGQTVSPFNLDFGDYSQRPVVSGPPSRSTSSVRPKPRGESKRASLSSNVEPVAKRLRSSNKGSSQVSAGVLEPK